ncbi:MAG: HAMP domain-containing histidine kinase [Solirubrobacteraceae bacterium]|nr:HAMP domain-containing histidine kinase [Solirubrobacteraceae bacterium]
MTRGLAIALGTALLLAGLAWAVYDWHAAWVTFAAFAALGIVTVVAGQLLATRRERLGGLRRQALAVGVLVAIQTAIVTALFIELMFVSPHDAFFTALVVVDAAVLGLVTTWAFGRRALRDIDATRSTLAAATDGRRDVRTGVEGGGELADLAADVDAMITRLDGEERARRSLVAAISHDLRTPITSLRLLADAIQDGVVDEVTAREYASRMSTHVQALSALIDDLFELSRLESGELRWSMQQVALAELVRDTVEAMRPEADAADVRVRAVIEAGDPLAEGDPARLQRVLFNLIQNAIRHTPADGTVTVRATLVGDAVEIEVADDGSGIPAPQRELVFEPFHRADPSRTDGGAGLGLAISRAIVEAHGGRIWIADADVGTAVRVRLQAV